VSACYPYPLPGAVTTLLQLVTIISFTLVSLSPRLQPQHPLFTDLKKNASDIKPHAPPFSWPAFGIGNTCQSLRSGTRHFCRRWRHPSQRNDGQLFFFLFSFGVHSQTAYECPPQLFLGNEDKVYIIDKAEGNAAQINGHPAWGAVWCVCASMSLKLFTSPSA
jgi:hypothetical protein